MDNYEDDMQYEQMLDELMEEYPQLSKEIGALSAGLADAKPEEPVEDEADVEIEADEMDMDMELMAEEEMDMGDEEAMADEELDMDKMPADDEEDEDVADIMSLFKPKKK